MNILSKVILLIVLFIEVSFTQGVLAGTKIKNIAYLKYSVSDQNYTAVSNQLIDTVDQRLDMQIVCQENENLIVGVNEKKRAFSFRMVNRGNGTDTYSLLSIGSNDSDFQVLNQEIYLDDGDNTFSSLSDTLITDINLSADANVTLFFVSDIPKDADKFSLNGIEAHSHLQGNLLYGESKTIGDYFVLRATQEEATSSLCTYEVSHLALELEKSSTLSSDKLYHRSVIHYTIALNVVGTGVIHDVVITDVIPEGTTYVSGTLQLDGERVDDAKSQEFVRINIGTITQVKESTDPKHIITFDVTVK